MWINLLLVDMREFFRQLFHRCNSMKNREVLAFYHYRDVSWGLKSPSTAVSYKCTVCGKIKVVELYNAGYLTREQLK